jgi:hypothetical protein
MALADLSMVIDRSNRRTISRINELCLIGLVSYFEAFCKDHFAFLLNLEPTLLETLRSHGQDTSIDLSDLLLVRDNSFDQLGFLLAERYDFGSAQKINALYLALLTVTPFSKDDMRIYDTLLRERNLIVHHGGTYTLSYIRQSKPFSDESSTRPFMDSLTITATHLDKYLLFIENIAKKILKGTHVALTKYIGIEKITCSREKKKALRFFVWWGEASL